MKWNSAVEYRKDGLDIVEVPIVYETNYILLPRKVNLKNTLEGERLAKATVHRAIFIKNGQGKTIVRILTFVPSAEYLEKSRHNINFTSYKDVLNKFEGSLIVKKWDEKVLNIFEFDNGKGKYLNIIRADGLNKKAENQKVNSQDCNWVETPIFTWVCVVVPTGDDVADDERCQENGLWVEAGTSWEYQCVEVDEDALFDGCLQEGSSAQDCNCMILGVDCNGGGENPPPLPEVINDVNNPCIKASVESVINAGIKNKVSSFINSTFQQSDVFHIHFSDGNIGGQNPPDAYTVTAPLSSLTEVKVNIRFNNTNLNNASKEYIAVVILHESIHGWIDLKFADPGTNASQHNLIASSNYFNIIKNDLKSMFPNLSDQDATDLTWSGLSSTVAFNNLPATERDRILQTCNDYRDVTKPNGKGTHC